MSLDRVRDLCAAAAAAHARGDVGAGLGAAQEAVELCRATLGEDHYAYPLALGALGWMLDAGGQDAGPTFAAAAERARALADDDFEHALAALVHVRDWKRERGDRQGAAELQREIVQLHATSLGDDHPRYFSAKAQLATF